MGSVISMPSANITTKHVDLKTLKQMYQLIKEGNYSDYLTNDMISSIKATALESYDPDESDNHDEEEVEQIIKRKTYALKCLLLASVKLNENFYSTFLKSLIIVFDMFNSDIVASPFFIKLYDYMYTSPLEEKFLLLQTLSTCFATGKLNFAIFDKFPPHDWRIELLLFVLFDKLDAEVNTVQNVINKINIVNDLDSIEPPFTTENILDFLVCYSQDHDFDIHFVNDLFHVIPMDPSIIKRFFLSFTNVSAEIDDIKMSMLTAHYIKFEDCRFEELIFLLKYPIEALSIFMQKEMDNFQQLVDFNNILQYTNLNLNTQITILMQSNPTESFIEWNYRIGFEVVRLLISDIFPAYENYSAGTSNKDYGNISFVSEMSIECTCSTFECILHNTTKYCDILYYLNRILAKVIFNCCRVTEKVIEVIKGIVLGINKAQKIHDLIDALEVLYDYNVKFTDVELYQLFNKITSEDYEKEVHKYLIKHSFSGSYEKTIDQLLDEIEDTYPGVTNSVIDVFDDVQYRLNKKSIFFPDRNKIVSWNKEEIQEWATFIRDKNIVHQVSDVEILAVIKRAIQVTLSIEMRHVQLLTVLLMIKSNKGVGRLAQVNTGEGKTVIIAVLAAYFVVKGHKVDVYTSSSVLAIPQAKELKPFYSSLGISVTDNIKSNTNYNTDVIYGTNSSFQRDVLQDDFRQSRIRKGRDFDVAIVDEVDNMLIDGNDWILMLSSEMPAMDYLEIVLAAIYIQVNEAARCLVERDGQVYCLVDEGNVKPETNVQEVPIKESKRDFIMNQTETHLRKLIRDIENCEDIEENYPEVKIPNHLREVICKIQLKKWIANAINAMFWYVNGEDYIIKNGVVTIVDADNTGILKTNSHYSAGLHQFLQIKHGARVQPENFTTNFISNIGLFSRYTSKLYGLSGTLGSTETKLFLHDTYNVDSVVIPPFKLKQHKHLIPITVTKEEGKYIEIAKSCIRKLQNGQAALIIMKYIRETEALAEIFKNTFNYDTSKIKIVKSDDDSEILENVLCTGEAIITTNVAGRGTDIKLHEEVENSGGLHVCLTFLPLNSRVEQQNIGRTSRKGNRGTSQFVIYGDTNKMKQIRDKQEAINMVKATGTVKIVKAKDRMFRKFCLLLRKVKGRISVPKNIEIKAIEERFAIWLLLNEDKINDDNDDIDKSYDEFEAQILEDDRNNELIKNPCMYIELGNRFLQRKMYFAAIREYNKATVLDTNFSEHAYYNRAWAYLAKYGGDVKTYKSYIDKAINDLKRARKLIEDKEYGLHLLQVASNGAVFSEQVNHKLNLYNIHKKTIELAIGPDVDAINEQLKKLEEERKTSNLSETDKTNIDNIIEKLKEDKKEMGVIGRAKTNNQNIKIESVGDDLIPKDEKDKYQNEIAEFRRNGWIGEFKICETKEIDWLSVFFLLGIGLSQLVIGGAITVFSLGTGASFGIGLISEGVSDIITAIKDGIINRDFNWETWALMKVISIAVSVVCAGFKVLKDAAKTAYAGAKNIITTGAKTLTQTTKAGWKIVAKRIGFDLGTSVAKEIATELISYGIDKTVIPTIEEKIMESVRDPIQSALLNNTKVKQMLKLDEKNGNRYYENQIRTIAHNLLSPKQNSKLEMIATQIATRVADHKGLGLVRQTVNGIIGTSELHSFTTTFINNLNKAFDDIEVDSIIDDNSEENHYDFNSHEERNEYKTEFNMNTRSLNDEIDLSKVDQLEEQVKVEKKVRKVDYLSEDLAGMATTNMLQILKGKIISPITRLGINYSVDKLSLSVTDNLRNEQENYRSLRNVINYQNNMNNKSNISGKSYSKDELDRANQVVNEIKNGGPAGLVHLGAISAATDTPIEVYDSEGRLKYTIGDTKKSTPVSVQYHEPEIGAKTGHFTLRDGSEPVSSSKMDNMCLFNVIAEQTGHDSNELKQSALNIMENNIECTAQQMKHINRLEMYDKASLLEGGAQYYGENPDQAKHYIKMSNGIIGHGNSVPGHSNRHIPFKGDTTKKLIATSQETGRNIEVYDSEGNCYVYGAETGNLEPIKLQLYTPKGDKSAECFTSLGGKERYYMHDPNDKTYFNIISKQTGLNSDILKDQVLAKMDKETVPITVTCIENYSKRETKHGFPSIEEQAFVFHHVMKTQEGKDALEKLNMYAPGKVDSNGDPMDAGEYIKHEVKLSTKVLNLPRDAFAGEWKKGRFRRPYKMEEVVLVLQHHPGRAGDKEAPVHIQTIYPARPKKSSPI